MSSPEPSDFACIIYRFIEPVRLWVRDPDGRVSLRGYGAGEQIRVLHPQAPPFAHPLDLLDEIPLADGSVIVEYRAARP